MFAYMNAVTNIEAALSASYNMFKTYRKKQAGGTTPADD